MIAKLEVFSGLGGDETGVYLNTATVTQEYLKNRAICADRPGFHSNPIIKNRYTADPAPFVYGDTLYLYTTHDEDRLVNRFYTMNNWHCFSTKNMVDWTDHGEVFSLDDIEWADGRAWAPQCIERNGMFYLYCPVHKAGSGMAIAVGVSDSPAGPFRDIGYPLVDEGDWNDIDPTVFIDDDGQAYLYFGNPELRYVLLNEDMISYDTKAGVGKIPMTEEAFSKGSHMTGTSYAEGPWFYKRNGRYYMVYAAFGGEKDDGQQHIEHLAYSTSNGPTGPWVYGGVLMSEEGGTFTNHPGIADFKGHSYLFYHTGELPGGNLFHRSVCVAEFKYKADGSIDTISKCDGVYEV
ncbi:MAG: glycoside hydrolase family 43 protein [Lachnospiraceae bacterium]|nr:glycoside hydrolase family 43 protein [Lachnospiraceae bacterium]